MLIRVLGSAAGGGFPQWNCGCPNCRGVRAGDLQVTARTQECVAVSADSAQWFLLNCSPEIRAAILLTNGDLDHCLGLLSLRESHPLVIYATDRLRRGFTDGNVLYRTLDRFPGQVTWRALKLGREEELAGVEGCPSGLLVEAVAMPGKLPIHLEADGTSDPEDSVGFRIRERATGRILAYLSGVGAVTDAVRRAVEDADCVFFDGTFWSSDELPGLGLGTKRAEQMAHLPVGGPDGSLARLHGLAAQRRIFIHVNNTNPLLRDDSAERATVEAAGWEVARDGLEVRI